RRSAKIGSDRTALVRTFGHFAWGLLFFNFLVIGVGTVVRATGSGDGCGSHWPLCKGEIIPVATQVKTIIELTHRLVSGLDGLLVLALVTGGFVLFPKGHPARRAVVVSLALTGVEALLGAYLVEKGLVAGNTSAARAVWMSIHLCTTFLLLASLALSAWFSS